MNERFSRAETVARIELAHETDFTLGTIHVRPGRREIVGANRREIVEPRVMRVLVALAHAHGEILSRDDLGESCWDGVIVGDDAINRSIGQLRKLAEMFGSAFTIETISRVGYRLKAAEPADRPGPEQQPSAGFRASPTSVVAPTSAPAPAKAVRPGRTRGIAVASAAGLVVLITAGIGAWRFWPKTPAAPVDASVAVLPFVNMSGDPKENYFSDGFSEELINDLTNEPHLEVASRTSSFAFKGRNESIGTIARALYVHAIVEGSVRESGDRVRITAQLIDANNGYHLWSADYTRNLTDALSLQDELARAIASALTHRLVPASTAPHPRIDPAVYRLYLAGIDQMYMPSPQGGARHSRPSGR